LHVYIKQFNSQYSTSDLAVRSKWLRPPIPCARGLRAQRSSSAGQHQAWHNDVNRYEIPEFW